MKRKKLAATRSQVDTAAIEKVLGQMENGETIKAVDKSDQEIGCDQLNKILPDTWKNISWVLQNSISALTKQALRDSRRLEEVREFAVVEN